VTFAGTRGAAVATAAIALIGASSANALAAPDLRQPRTAGPLTVYPDDARANVFYYPPGELAVAVGSDGAPDVHLLHARYTGSASTGDRGVALVRSIFTVRVTMAGPLPAELTAARRALAADGRSIELRPLPIRRVESAIVYAPATPVAASDGAAASEAEPQPLPDGHFESSASAAAPQNGYWTERVYTLGLLPGDAQLLSSALERGSVALSVGYAFLADGIGPDRPLEAISGSPALVRALRKALPAPANPEAQAAQPSGPHVVRAGAVGITADLTRWPHLLRRIDINDSAPPGYAALDVYCYDFSQGGADGSLYEKAVEIEADGVGGRKVTLSTRFSRAHPDLYAASLRFPVAVRLDRPYRFRVHETRDDGTSTSGAWQERQSWVELLDVTDQGDDR
jgi:hypothetical protein